MSFYKRSTGERSDEEACRLHHFRLEFTVSFVAGHCPSRTTGLRQPAPVTKLLPKLLLTFRTLVKSPEMYTRAVHCPDMMPHQTIIPCEVAESHDLPNGVALDAINSSSCDSDNTKPCVHPYVKRLKESR